MQRLNGPDSVKVIRVVEVKAKRGMGMKVTQYARSRSTGIWMVTS